jgi:hypothetical protein
MTDQHTPGPWLVDFGETTSVRLSDGSRVASVAHLRLYSRAAASEVAANAHLIAAAPDMLEALKVAAKAELYDPATGLIDADVLDIVQDVARAAYAKATGGRP